MELRPPPVHVSDAPPRRQAAPWVSFVLVAVLAAAAGYGLHLAQSSRGRTAGLARTRALASKLKAAGALDEAAALYERYLTDGPERGDEHDAVAYSLAQLYLDAGRFEKALRWLYDADEDAKGPLHDDIGKKIVHALEATGRGRAARAALAEQTELPAAEHRTADPVVATIEQESIYRSDVLRAEDALPPEARRKLPAGAHGQEEFLRQYVAQELLWRKAQRLELDRDPDVRRHVEATLRAAAVQKFMEREVLAKIVVEPSDVQNYFDAHRSAYTNNGLPVSLDMARPRVEQDYRASKAAAALNQWVTQELATDDVKLFAERLQK